MVARLEIELGNCAFLADDGVEALIRPDRRAFPRNARKPQHQRVKRLAFLAERRLDPGNLPPERLRFLPARRPFGGVGALEALADPVDPPAEPLDLAFHSAQYGRPAWRERVSH